MPASPSTFGEMLRYLRRRARLTQKELGIAVGFSDAQITRLESGQRLPDPLTVQARFVPALGLAEDSAAARRLVALASAASDESWNPLPTQPAPPGPKRTNLPAPLTRFVGRERELREVQRLLDVSRFVTLTGSGGVGKTRLAQEVGAVIVGAMHRPQDQKNRDRAGDALPLHRAAPTFPDGVWLAELAALADPALVPQTVAAVFGLPERPGRAQVESLIAHLSDMQLLLILDNCEHLIGACAELAESLLVACPQLHVLATSREPLRVPSEAAWRVPSLQTPDPAALPGLEQVLGYEAVQLFVEHAALAQPGFALTDGNLAAVAQVCARLDGIPLAIEMAAAQVAAMPVESITAGLGDRFALLTRGARTALPRQQTLRATLDWSFRLLSQPERTLLARLSVFAGGWTMEAAQVVCADPSTATPLLPRSPTPPLPLTPAPPLGWLGPGDVLPLLLQLVHKSLVVAAHRDGRARYNLLETVRLYASEKLDGQEAERLRDFHLEYFLGLAEATTEFDGEHVDAWLQRLDPEYDNLRLALSWACSRDTRDTREMRDRHGERALRLAAALRAFWVHRTRFIEGMAWLEAALARGAGAGASARAWALDAKTILLVYQGDYPRGLSAAEASLTLFRQTDDRAGTAWCLEALAGLGWITASPQTKELAEEALGLFRELGSLSGISRALRTLGIAWYRLGDADAASRCFEEAAATARANGAVWFFAFCMDPLSIVNPGRAIALCEHELAQRQQAGNDEHVATLLSAYGGLLLGAGEYIRAQSALEASLLKWDHLGGNNLWSATALLGLGQVALSLGHIDRALERFARYERDSRVAGITYAVHEARFQISNARLAQGDLTLAARLARECLQWFSRTGDRRAIACCLIQLAGLAHRSADPRRACVLLGAAEVVERGVDPMSGVSIAGHFRHWRVAAQRAIVEAALAAARSSLGAAQCEAAYLTGQCMTLEQAVVYALQWDESGTPA
jgi:predicted ATPase/transcriptional regulator with XRE-family HTH domain